MLMDTGDRAGGGYFWEIKKRFLILSVLLKLHKIPKQVAQNENHYIFHWQPFSYWNKGSALACSDSDFYNPKNKTTGVDTFLE